jgi:CRISPR-associated protein Cas1
MRKTIILTGYGYWISKKGDLLVIKKGGGEKLEVSTGNVGQIIAFSRGLGLSGDAINLMLRQGVKLILVSRGRPIGMLQSFRKGAPVKLRKEQVYAQLDVRAISIAKSIIYAKISNQIQVLRWLRRGRFKRKPDKADLLRDSYSEMDFIRREVAASNLDINNYRKRLLLWEAEASRVYWDVLSRIFPLELGFDRRRKRFEKPSDPFNLALNYMYTLLASQIWSFIELSSLDPWIGYLHMDSNRRPSLVMDLMEEFRQPVVDKPLIEFFLGLKDYEGLIDDGLDRGFLKDLSRLFFDRIREKVSFDRYTASIEGHMGRQPKKLARYIIGKLGDYIPYNVV